MIVGLAAVAHCQSSPNYSRLQRLCPLTVIIREEWNNDEVLVGTTHDCDEE